MMMKKRYVHIGIVLACMLICSSCNDFLQLKPRDKKVVSTIEDYRDIMASYVHHIKTTNRPYKVVLGIGPYTTPCFDVAGKLGIYTGETNLYKGSSANYDKTKDEYTIFGKNLLLWQNTDADVWNRYYEFLGPINLIIADLPTAEGTNEDLRNYVLGEALVWRAFSYFKLLQYFAPYKDNRYGIPVFLKPYEDVGNAMPERKTQTEVFKQILGDCQKALDLLEVTASNDWNCAWREDFIHAMMASIYTWKAMSGAAEDADWGNAEKCATVAMRGRSLTNSPEVFKRMFDSFDVDNQPSLNSDEFYFRIIDGSNEQLCKFTNAYYDKGGSLADGFINSVYYNQFRDNDIRKETCFANNGTQSDKYNQLNAYWGQTGSCLLLFRLAEMYLIKAEAMLRQGNTGEAKKVMEEFEQARYTGNIQLPSNPEALLQEILDERLREFYMENDFRWLDMKRQGVSIIRIINGEKFTLEPDDFRYSFPIPREEIELNSNMVQTPGWDKIML